MKIGKIVQFSEGNGDFPAIVTKVNADSTVNLTVFGDGIFPEHRKSIPQFSAGAQPKAQVWSELPSDEAETAAAQAKLTEG